MEHSVFGLTTYLLSFAAGGLSLLSPCVLPLLPILIGSAVAGHRFGAYALAAGLALSFTLSGTLIASLGAGLAFDPATLRQCSAVLLVLVGGVLLLPSWQQKFSALSAGTGSIGQQWASRIRGDGLLAQFALGGLLGVAWSPCVGPTLGAAISLAAQGQYVAQIALVMCLFGLGAALPIIALGGASRRGLAGNQKLAKLGRQGKKWLAAALILVGILILSGADKLLEAALVAIMPDALIRFTTSI